MLDKDILFYRKDQSIQDKKELIWRIVLTQISKSIESSLEGLGIVSSVPLFLEGLKTKTLTVYTSVGVSHEEKFYNETQEQRANIIINYLNNYDNLSDQEKSEILQLLKLNEKKELSREEIADFIIYGVYRKEIENLCEDIVNDFAVTFDYVDNFSKQQSLYWSLHDYLINNNSDITFENLTEEQFQEIVTIFLRKIEEFKEIIPDELKDKFDIEVFLDLLYGRKNDVVTSIYTISRINIITEALYAANQYTAYNTLVYNFKWDDTYYGYIQERIDLPDFEIFEINDFWNESVNQIKKDVKNLENNNWEKSKFQDLIKDADAGNAFELQSKWVIPWYNYDNKSYEQVRGKDKFLKILTNENNLQFTKSQENDWLRLIMPKNTRRVEVEDLNRNFWVIGGALSRVLDWCFNNNSPIIKILGNLLKEIPQLWENIIYLWASLYINYFQSNNKIQVFFLPIEGNSSDADLFIDNQITIKNKEKRYDNMDNLNKLDLMSLYRQFGYLVNKYPNTNLIIIPYYRENNYRKNYYSKLIIPGCLIYDCNRQKFKQVLREYQDISLGAMSISLYDYIQQNLFKEFYGYNFSMKINNKEVPLAISIQKDKNCYDIRKGIYAEKEVNDKITLIRPFYNIDETTKEKERIEEDDPSMYYGAVRIIPEVETHYDNGIKIDSIKFKAYDAIYDSFISNYSSPLMTFSSNDISDYTIDDDEQFNKTIDFSIGFNNNNNKIKELGQKGPLIVQDKQLNKFYMGEVISWIGKTIEKEKFETAEIVEFANNGILLKLGQFLPDSEEIGNDSNGIQRVTLKQGDTPENGWAIQHQFHDTYYTTAGQVIANNQYEVTNYDLNLTFSHKDYNTISEPKGGKYGWNLPNEKSKGKGRYQKNTAYYYCKWKTNHWGLDKFEPNDGRENYEVSCEEIIEHGLDTIDEYLTYHKDIKRGFGNGGVKLREISDLIDLTTYNIDNKPYLDLSKICYFVGAIGAYPWCNNQQFYWEGNILFGIFIYIPKDLISEKQKETIIKDCYYKENSLGLIFFSKEILRIEKNFKLPTDESDNVSPFYLNNGDRWRLAKIIPDYETLSAVRVKSNKNENELYLPITEEIKSEIKGSNFLNNYIPAHKSELQTYEDFSNNSINYLKNNPSGQWSIFDGYNTNSNNNNIYNINNYKDGGTTDSLQTVQARFDFSSNTPKLKDIMVRIYEKNKRDKVKAWTYKNTLPNYKDINGKQITNTGQKPDAYEDSDYLDNADKIIWQSGSLSTEEYTYTTGTFSYEKYKRVDSLGLDISHHQSIIGNDFTKETEFSYVILKAGPSGFASPSSPDENFYQNAKYCLDHNIKFGVYWFSHAKSTDDASKEADYCINVLKGFTNWYKEQSGNRYLPLNETDLLLRHMAFPVYYDYEDLAGYSTYENRILDNHNNGSINGDIIETFLKKIEEEGYLPGLYIHEKFLKNITGEINSAAQNYAPEIFENDYVKEIYNRKLTWVATYRQYGRNAIYSSTKSFLDKMNEYYGMWQYCGVTGTLSNQSLQYITQKQENGNWVDDETRTISAFSTELVDRNICFYDYTKIQEERQEATKKTIRILKWDDRNSWQSK